jgi:AbrB family looped-hinge helix DNA binding protein
MVSFRRMTDISHIVALSPEGQVAIPKDILEALGLQEGAKLEVALEGHRVVMRTVSEEYPDWRTLQGAFGPVDQTTSEILAEGRREEFEKERRLLEHLSD